MISVGYCYYFFFSISTFRSCFVIMTRRTRYAASSFFRVPVHHPDGVALSFDAFTTSLIRFSTRSQSVVGRTTRLCAGNNEHFRVTKRNARTHTRRAFRHVETVRHRARRGGFEMQRVILADAGSFYPITGEKRRQPIRRERDTCQSIRTTRETNVLYVYLSCGRRYKCRGTAVRLYYTSIVVVLYVPTEFNYCNTRARFRSRRCE